jgi:hypothetical protein
MNPAFLIIYTALHWLAFAGLISALVCGLKKSQKGDKRFKVKIAARLGIFIFLTACIAFTILGGKNEWVDNVDQSIGMGLIILTTLCYKPIRLFLGGKKKYFIVSAVYFAFFISLQIVLSVFVLDPYVVSHSLAFAVLVYIFYTAYYFIMRKDDRRKAVADVKAREDALLAAGDPFAVVGVQESEVGENAASPTSD